MNRLIPKMFATSLSRSALVFGVGFGLLLPAARSQSGIGSIVYSVGTTIQDLHGTNWAYVLWQGTEPSLVSNRVFAVYSKPGDATNTAPYIRRSLVSVQTDPRVIEPLLERAGSVGDDLTKLDQDVGQLFGSFIPASSVTRAEQLSAVIRGSLGSATYYQDLLLLARNHPGVDLALGFADAEVIPSGRTTLEVRAFDLTTGHDLAVIGRVTVEAGNPTVLPAPGPPVLVPVPNPMGDLNLKFRWGTPDNLRRLGLIQFGYNLYRVEQGYAATRGWSTGNPPLKADLEAVVATNHADAKRVNQVPVTPSAVFTLSEAANLTPPGDTNTTFIMDDDGRGQPGYMNYNWTNGAQFIYYVVGRDVLGRDGLVSLGLLTTVCDRMPPLPPTAVQVVNDYQFDPATLTSAQVLRINWKQNLQTNDTVTNYWVYRWTNMMEMNANSGDISNNLIGKVAHIPGVTTNSFLDNGLGSPTVLGAYGGTFWYTVRAGDAGACGQNLSQPAGPAYGVLRQRVGPAAGTGFIEINCLRPEVSFLGESQGLHPSSVTNYDFHINCARTDSRFDWAEFSAVGSYTVPPTLGSPVTYVVSNYLGRVYFLGNSMVSVEWTPPRDPSGQGYQYYPLVMQVECRAGLNNGKISTFNQQTVTPPSSEVYDRVSFQAVTYSFRTVAGEATSRTGCYEHDPGGGGGGSYGTNNICVHVQPSAGSKEYRIYRRVDDGPLSLMAAGAVSNSPDIEACDNNTPLNGGTMCFYTQLLDENGNPSPLTWLGCAETAPVTPPPTPMLAKITPIGTAPAKAQMSLSWFCPSYGANRFEVYVAATPMPPNTNSFAFSSLLLSTGAPPANVAFALNSTNYNLPFYSYLTPMVGPDFGNSGSDFNVPCNIEVGKHYYVSVRALSKLGDPGDWSNFQSFIWTPSNAPALQVPWPTRPLPTTNANFVTVAFYLSPTNPPGLFRTGSPSGIGVYLGYGFVGLEFNIGKHLYGPVDPNTLVETNVFGQSLFPCALYRYQTANGNFPTVSGDVIQVSPLMEKIAYEWSTDSGGLTNTDILDPFVAMSGAYPNIALWLRDTQPQISGARYKYILVRFDPVTHEIDQLIPSNEVDVP